MVRLGMVALLMACGAANANAQVVRGAVVEAEAGVPVTGVFVVLVDSTGRSRGGVLTDERGVYAIPASHAGTYSVRAERIGHASTTSATFVLSAGATQTTNLRLRLEPIVLAGIDVGSDNRCISRPKTGQRTAQLWEEARKALSVAQWTQREKRFQFEARSYTRELDAASLLVKNESQRYGISGTRPYEAVGADSLIRYGFARNEGAGIVFYGPDADVLLSDDFLDEYCFHSVEGSGDNKGRIGLAFQPSMSSKVAGAKGTLWLDAKTYELHHIDFTYVNLPAQYRARGTGGLTEFKRLSNGAWIVSRWYIRMPTVVAGQGSGAYGGYRAVSFQEEGGEVVSIRDHAATHHLAADGAIRGVVYDSINGRPLEGATVYLSGTVHRTTTDNAGNFELRNVPPGKYIITHSHSSLDSLPAFPAPTFVDVKPLDTAVIPLAVPSVRTLLASVCSEPPAGRDNDRTLFGFIRDERGNPMEGVSVTATFKRYTDARVGDSRFTLDNRSATTRSDAAGHYRICNLPGDTRIDLVAGESDRKAKLQVVLSGRAYRRADLRIGQ
jgi:hypothetical protein